MKKLRIGFIGNFENVPESTENHRKWAFEQLGYEVVVFQENRVSATYLYSWIGELDILFYSHTHDPSYVIHGLKEVFAAYKQAGVPTVSVHLDLWRNLARWTDVGQEATWHTEYVFTPDNTGEWPSFVNHKYLMPGVVDKYCFLGRPSYLKYPHEIIFVGSKGYHPEYPERPAIIDFLRETYGNRFAHYGNDGLQVVRGAELNSLVASAKIIVGDSCFSNTDHQIRGYWSDRIPEITGRGGFLMHPFVADNPHKGVAWYKPGDFADLKRRIDHYLDNPWERDKMRIDAFTFTKHNMTYTKIAEKILEEVFK